MEDAGQLAEVEFPVLPEADGVRITRMGRSFPRTYWQRYWVQLYREVVSWLPPAAQKDADTRLRDLDVVCDG
jgi:hypothetical protein